MRDPGTIVNEVVQMVRDTIGPVASFKIAVVVQRLPKTRSGKILRGTMQKIANGNLYASADSVFRSRMSLLCSSTQGSPAVHPLY